jgi:hypothetical protein
MGVDDRGQSVTGAWRCEFGEIDVKTKDYLRDVPTAPEARSTGQNGTDGCLVGTRLISAEIAQCKSVLTLAFCLKTQILVCTTKEDTLFPDLMKIFATVKNQTVIRSLCVELL